MVDVLHFLRVGVGVALGIGFDHHGGGEAARVGRNGRTVDGLGEDGNPRVGRRAGAAYGDVIGFDTDKEARQRSPDGVGGRVVVKRRRGQIARTQREAAGASVVRNLQRPEADRALVGYVERPGRDGAGIRTAAGVERELIVIGCAVDVQFVVADSRAGIVHVVAPARIALEVQNVILSQGIAPFRRGAVIGLIVQGHVAAPVAYDVHRVANVDRVVHVTDDEEVIAGTAVDGGNLEDRITRVEQALDLGAVLVVVGGVFQAGDGRAIQQEQIGQLIEGLGVDLVLDKLTAVVAGDRADDEAVVEQGEIGVPHLDKSIGAARIDERVDAGVTSHRVIAHAAVEHIVEG